MRRKMSSRLIVVTVTSQFGVSLALLIWASVADGAVPRWGAVLDVIIAFTPVLTAMWLYVHVDRAREQHVPRANQVAVLLPPIVLVALWLTRERVDMNILLPRLAWRLFLVSQTLPAALAAPGLDTNRS
jgi:hypothetical protein